MTAKLCFILLLFACLSHDAHAEAALAYGQNGGGWAFGTSSNMRTKAEAEWLAVHNCSQRGPNCGLVTSFYRSCLAIAVQDGGSGYGWQTNSNLDRARAGALSACRKYGTSCSIQGTVCDSNKEPIALCIQPVFEEVVRLRQKIIDEPAEAEKSAATIRYLNAKYCKASEEVPVFDQVAPFSGSCAVYTGMFRGERVYWGKCGD